MRESGHAAVEFALGVGVLMLPVALAILSFGPWLERRVVAGAAAAEAARAAVVHLDHTAGEEMAIRLAASHGIGPELVRIGWCGSDPGASDETGGSCPLTRGSIVEATVELWVPLVETPWGEVGGTWAAGSHDEPVDLYRSLP